LLRIGRVGRISRSSRVDKVSGVFWGSLLGDFDGILMDF